MPNTSTAHLPRLDPVGRQSLTSRDRRRTESAWYCFSLSESLGRIRFEREPTQGYLQLRMGPFFRPLVFGLLAAHQCVSESRKKALRQVRIFTSLVRAFLRCWTSILHKHIETSGHVFGLHSLGGFLPISTELLHHIVLAYAEIAEVLYLKISELHLSATHLPERLAKRIVFSCPRKFNLGRALPRVLRGPIIMAKNPVVCRLEFLSGNQLKEARLFEF